MRLQCTKICLLVSVLTLAACQKNIKPQDERSVGVYTPELIDPEQLAVFDAGNAALASGDLNRAETLFKSIEASPPRYSGVQTNLGAIALQRKDFDAAEKHLNDATRLKPHNKHAWLFLGQLAMEKHHYDAANDAYRKALNSDENDMTAHFNLGVVNDLYLMEYDLAEEHYERYLELAGDSEASKVKQVKIWLKLLERK